MNLVIDQGNTRYKLGCFEGSNLLWNKAEPGELTKEKLQEALSLCDGKTELIYANSGGVSAEFKEELESRNALLLQHSTKLPFDNFFNVSNDKKPIIVIRSY